MAEAAHAEAGAAISPTGIKHEPNHLEGFSFSTSPVAASKRPLENTDGSTEAPEQKKLKTEDQPHDEQYTNEMSLIVQNALSNINDAMDQFNDGPEGRPDNNPDSHAVVPTTEAGAGIPYTTHSPSPPPTSLSDDPARFVRNANIFALGSIAVSMLQLLSQDSLNDADDRILDPTSEHRLRYRQLQRSLESVRKLYSSSPVIFAEDFDLDSPHSSIIMQFCNLAQMGSWLLEGGPDHVREADENLPGVFRDEIIGLPRRIVDMLVDLKTHRAINALREKGGSALSEEELRALFLDGFETKLREQNIPNQIIATEDPITDCLEARMNELRAASSEADLSSKYPWDGLIKKFSPHARNQLALATELGTKLGMSMPIPEPTPEPVAEDIEVNQMDLDELTAFFQQTASGLATTSFAELTAAFNAESLPSAPVEEGHPSDPPAGEAAAADGVPGPSEADKTNGQITDYKELEALVAASTSRYVQTTLQGLSPTPYQPTVPASTAESMAARANYMQGMQNAPQNGYYTSFAQPAPEQQQSNQHHQHQQHHQNQHHQQQPPPPSQGHGHNLPPNQSCSSALLYEKARQAALSRQTAHTRREGTHSTRRPWSQEEEKALMTGLDLVKGPHWSQILGLFGHNGSISDILKDRTQVQLKDKARNLKLFFLKTNSEMPYYLNTVTGELKTRAPTQAARKEAEERARLTSEDDHAKLQGTMALTAASQNVGSQGNRATGGAVGAVGPGVMTPAQAAAQGAAGSGGQHRMTPTQASASSAAATAAASQPSMATNLQALQNLQHLVPRTLQASQEQGQQQQQQFHQPGQQQATAQTSTPQGEQQAAQPYGQQPPSVQHYQQPASRHATPPQAIQTHHQQQYSSTPTPTATPVYHSPAPGAPSTPAQQHNHSHPAQSPAVGSQAAQSSPATPAFPSADPPAPHHEPEATLDTGPVPAPGELDSETEAALIRDLQAAVAQAAST